MRSAVSKNAWIAEFPASDAAKSTLICFPHAGGSTSYFFPWSTALAPDIRVLGVQYPGRQERRHDPPPASLGEMVDQIVDAVESLQVDRFTFFGHSMGAVLAYEVSRRLLGCGPEHLVLSGRRAPGDQHGNQFHSYSDSELVAETKRLGGPSSSLLDDQEMCEIFLPMIRQDYRIIEEYKHLSGPMLDCPMTVLVGDMDPRVTPREADGWRAYTRGYFQIYVRPGGHFFLENNRKFIFDLFRRALVPTASAAPVGQEDGGP